jgi:hypothetical protein
MVSHAGGSRQTYSVCDQADWLTPFDCGCKLSGQATSDAPYRAVRMATPTTAMAAATPIMGPETCGRLRVHALL